MTSPCLWVCEAQLVGSNTDHATVLVMKLLYVFNVALSAGNELWNVARCGQLWARLRRKRMECDIVESIADEAKKYQS